MHVILKEYYITMCLHCIEMFITMLIIDWFHGFQVE
jgi:hypothetical protein